MAGFEISADNLFASLLTRQANMPNLAAIALSRGADLSLKGDNDGAIREFKRAIGLDSSPDNVVKAYGLLAAVYIQQDKIDDAIKAYKASLSMSPSSADTRAKLGDIYFSLGRYNEAENEYKTAANIDPASSRHSYSLGQVYLATNRFGQAEDIFKQVVRRDPGHHGGYYALGQTYKKLNRPEDAIGQFKKAIDLDKSFYNAHVDLGSAYADLNRMDEAREQLSILKDKAPGMADLLQKYLDTAAKPRLLAAYSTEFLNTLGPGTSLAELDSSLAAPNTSKQFNVVFIFNKEMDEQSVRNIANWSISRAGAGAPGGAYNWGMPVASTETLISPIPLTVVYMPDSLTATVSFKVSQNDAADATLDPSHITFKFAGKDAYGNLMDTSADEYNRFSMIV